VAAFGKPDPLEVNPSGGALTASYSIDVPAGPGGLTPTLALAYARRLEKYSAAKISDARCAAPPWALGSPRLGRPDVRTTGPYAPGCARADDPTGVKERPLDRASPSGCPCLRVHRDWIKRPSGQSRPSPIQLTTTLQLPAILRVGRYVSADGTRQVRMGTTDITGAHGKGPHMNFEELQLNARTGKMNPVDNRHIYLTQ
jgi:hypothetical protein